MQGEGRRERRERRGERIERRGAVLVHSPVHLPHEAAAKKHLLAYMYTTLGKATGICQGNMRHKVSGSAIINEGSGSGDHGVPFNGIS